MMSCKSHTVNPPPSRTTNPFATCWTRPGALPFRFPAGDTAKSLVAKLAASGWWGEIVGPHGSGKSTLLEALKPAVQDAGRDVVAVALRDAQRRLHRNLLTDLSSAKLLIVDGYEQLNWFQQQRLKHRCRRAGAGLLVTAHASTSLPTLVALAPDLPLVEQLVAQLCKRSNSRVTPADVAASHAGRGSNVRDIFFDLYDRHERLRAAG
jgi:energy-coupling factor transporter ATP-binding protein EcfA2